MIPSPPVALTRFFGDAVAMRLGPVRFVRLGGTVALAALGVVLLSPQPGPALLGFACVGMGLAAICPMTFSAAGRTPAASSPGEARSAVTTLGYFGFLIGPPVIGFAAQAIGLRAALAILLVTSACMVALASNAGPARRDEPL